MKSLLFIISMLCMMLAVSCYEKGTTRLKLDGTESTLPPELKGLKLYNVSMGDGNSIKVAVMNNQAKSVTYPVGKTTQTTIILNSGQVIQAKEVIMVNDSFILIRK